jgi:hypothetical protein
MDNMRDEKDTRFVRSSQANAFARFLAAADPGGAEVSVRPVRLDLSAESAAIQQCFSLTTNHRTVLSA